MLSKPETWHWPNTVLRYRPFGGVCQFLEHFLGIVWGHFITCRFVFFLPKQNIELSHRHKKTPWWETNFFKEINKLKNRYQHFNKVPLMNFKMILIQNDFDWDLKSTKEKLLLSWLPAKRVWVYKESPVSKGKHPQTLAGSVDQNANLLPTDKVSPVLCLPAVTHRCTREGTQSSLFSWQEAGLGRSSSTCWPCCWGRWAGTLVLAISQLVPINEYQESSLGKVRWPRCYFISGLLSSGSLCLFT